MKSFKLSLRQLLGNEYIDSVIAGASVLYDMDADSARDIADNEVDFIPDSHVSKMEGLLGKVSTRVIPAMRFSQPGATTDSFKKAAHLNASPVGGIGYIRLGEDGRLYLMAKSEHYHTPLGHNFPGYKLIDNARALGITNSTHNNTRGNITRFLEKELVRTVNGLGRNDDLSIDGIIASEEPHVLNRVINLETGSVACEAGIKMMLARFYKLDINFEKPKYTDRIPVFFVIGDNEGGGKANYHGTSIIAQTMRDMWPGFYDKIENAGIYKVCPVNINDYDDFKAKFAEYDKPPYKVAGFTHEIIMMNYGGIKLDEDFLKKAYKLCHDNDTPVMCDEIQSCMWYPGMYLFRLYGLDPDFVVIGKGFPGGQYAASRIITTFEMDSLNQFGALVTNGQEELASLAYLITMEFAQRNAAHIDATGRYYESRLKSLSDRYPTIIDKIEGKGHLSSIFFYEADDVLMFTRILTERCIDISSQTYKSKCPPAALTKPPVIATETMMDFLIERMDEALGEVTAKQKRGDQS